MAQPDASTSPAPPDAPVDALAPGATFGPFDVVAPVGSGAYGVVYEARRRPLQRRVALKVLHPHVLARPDALKRFERELAAAAALDHPHVVAVLDGGVLDGRGYLAMSFLDGESLAARLKARGALAVEDAVDAMLPIAAALDAVHAAGIVHRDVKPANVFLARGAAGGDHPVLLDFGIAKDLDDPAADLTRSQSWLGTPTYMSPEQIRQSKDVGPATDQWSFGVVLYECLTGTRPFDDEVLLDLMKSITAATPTRPDARRPSIPAGLADAVMRTLARDASERFPSMRAVAEALLPFASARVRAWWQPRYGARRRDERDDALDATTVKPLPARIPDPEGALPTLMADRPAVDPPPVPLAKPPTKSASTLSGQSADRAPTVIVNAPRSTAEIALRYAAFALVAGLAFLAGRNLNPPQPVAASSPPPALPPPVAPPVPAPPVVPPPPVVVDAARVVVADVVAPSADVPAARPAVARPAPERARSGSIQILCPSGRATIGDDTRAREISLPAPEPIAWPAGYVRVMIVANGGQTQSYIDVRAGRTTTFQNCPGM